MIKEKAQLLVNTLRSGKYKQGTGGLNTSNERFCCLGVACEICKDELGLEIGVGINEESITYNGKIGMLPEKVKDYFQFNSIIGRRADREEIKINGGCFISLASANDECCTFNQIADYIEKEYESL